MDSDTIRVDEVAGSLCRNRVNPGKLQEKIERSADAPWDSQSQFFPSK